MTRFVPLLLLFAAAACDLPRDNDGTIERIARERVVRVGVVESEPWVRDSNGVVSGIEGRLVEDLARELGARAVWVRGPESRLLAAVQHRELDMVIGGLTDELPWTSVLALTRPYYSDTVEVGLELGAAARTLGREGIRNDTVAVEVGNHTAAEVRSRGGIPLPVADLAHARGLVAAPGWWLAATGRRSSGLVISAVNHVLALPPGENAWLVRVERFLETRHALVATLLRSAAPGASATAEPPTPFPVPHR